ncbi:MAG: extracellular solute-binding protein [Defluviitaleaceae bacterium]|nr:extracellular solute-binding protein [Defluviitaleaceae bacterium]
MGFLRKRGAAIAITAVLLAVAMSAGCGQASSNTAPPVQTQTAADTQNTDTATDAPADNAQTQEAATDAPTVAPTPELSHQDITIYLWGDKPNQMDDVLAQFNATGGQELNMTLNIDWSSLDDYYTKIKLRLSAGEPVDACFDAQWITLMDFIAEGSYQDLSHYFLNDDYPGLKAAFSADYLNSNKLGTDGIYGIPFTQGFGTAPLIFIRGDLREKYGCPPVTDPDTYRQFLQAVADNDPSIVPYAASPNTYNTSKIYGNEHDLDNYNMNQAGVRSYIPVIPNLLDACVYVQDYQLKACAFINEPASAYADFPAQYQKQYLVIDNSLMARDFYEKGYLDKDFLQVSDPRGQFTAGKAASIYWDVSNYAQVVSALTAEVPDAKVEVYQPSEIYREGLQGKIAGAYAAWNFMCIPVTTSQEKTDRIMMFYNWMFSSWANHDLMELGIEGKNFVNVGTDEYKVPDGVDPSTNYNLPGYMLTWNPNFIKISADFPDDVVKYIKMQNDPATYYNDPYGAFTFQPDSVSTAAANPDIATLNAERVNIDYGMVANVQDAYAKWDEEFNSNKNVVEDMATIKAEFEKQFQAYLDSIKP